MISKVLFLCSVFPRFLGLQLSGGSLFLGVNLLGYLLSFRGAITYASIIFIIYLTISSIFWSGYSVLSIGYYALSVSVMLNRVRFSRKIYEQILNYICIIILITISLDFISPAILNFILFEERPVDYRTNLDLIRPVSFFRENSELGIIAAVLIAMALINNFQSVLIKASVILILSQSFLGMLVCILFLIIIKRNFMILILLFILISAIFVLYSERIMILIDLIALADFDVIQSTNLSFVKRLIHPYSGFIYVVSEFSWLDLIFGIGPGNSKLILQKAFSSWQFSDLSQGYILNSIFNFIINFGLMGFGLILTLLCRVHGLSIALMMMLLGANGIPILHPAILLLSTRLRE